YPENRRGSGSYALSYPSASSEGSTSTDNLSLGVEQEAQRRHRAKSISLKKAKKKPSPPMRSVSLIKDGQGAGAEPGLALPQQQPPQSLCLPLEPQSRGMVPTDSQGGPPARDPQSGHFPQHWCLPDWKANDPYRSLSGSSTATGTTVIDCAKTRGRKSSLPPPSPMEKSPKARLSFDLPLTPPMHLDLSGLKMALKGKGKAKVSRHHSDSTFGTKLGPKTSPIQPVMPVVKSPKARLSFDLPLTPPMHLDLSGLKMALKGKGKAKVSRHHSDSTFGTKLGPKTSPIQPVMPVVTQSDLRSVRLRSISRSEEDDEVFVTTRTTEDLFTVIHRYQPTPGMQAPPLRQPPAL
uniref:NHS like 2 n=1 Tax=Pelodiscus sinensis TaxID=13735 RepID=K7FB85_PELSI